MCMHQKKSGFTLLELLVVVAILAILAGLVIPQMGNTTERSQAATAAANLADVTRKIEEYRATNGAYGDGWDSLVATDGSTSGLYSALSPSLVALLSPTPVQVGSTVQGDLLRAAGIWHVMQHDSTYTGRPSDSGILSGHLTGAHGGGSNMPIVKLNVGTSGTPGPAYNMMASTGGVPGFNLHPTRFIDLHDFYVFGLGPKNYMVGETLVSAPIIDIHDVGRYYSRPIAIFAVPTVAAATADSTLKPRFIGVIGPDGQTSDMYLSSFYKQTARDH